MRIRTISLDSLGQFLGLSEFPFGLEPELFIPSEGTTIFFPDFPRANSDLIFVGCCQCSGATLEFFGIGRDALRRFIIADPPRQVAVPMSLRNKVGDYEPLIHCAVLRPKIKTMEPQIVHLTDKRNGPSRGKLRPWGSLF